MGAAPAVARMDRTSTARHRRYSIAPLQHGGQRGLTVGGVQSEDVGELGNELGRPNAQKSFSTWVLGLGARRGLSGRGFMCTSSRLTSPGPTNRCSVSISPVAGSITVNISARVVMVTWTPISRHGTEKRAEPNRIQDSLSILRVTTFDPELGPHLRQWLSSSRSCWSRSSGTSGDLGVQPSNDQNLWMAPRPGDVKERTFPRMI